MDRQKPTFFYELCRLCLEAEGICDIFESENLLQDIYACTGVIVFVSDKLPHKICIKCIKFIENAKKFRVFVKQNDEHLRSIFNGGMEVDIIKTIACQTPNVISQPQSICDEVQSEYLINGDKEYSKQIETEPNNLSFLEAGPVVVKTVSLRKDINNSSSSISSCADSPAGPVVVNTISLRKDLFHSSSSSSISSCMDFPTPTKSAYKKDTDPDELLENKVKVEKTCLKIKSNKDEAVDYICGMCSKEFETYKKFYLHQRLHNKKLVCPLHPCGKKFATKGDLEKHVRTHTGEKPYVCGFCKKGFSQRVSLRFHVRSLHPKKPVESESVQSNEHSAKAESLS